MTTTVPARRRRVPPRWIAAAAVAVLVVLMAVDTEYRTAETAAAAAPKKFDPAAFGAQNYQAKVVPAIQQSAVNLPVLLKALAGDKDAAGQKYGKRPGSTGPYTFAVKGTGKAGKARSGLLPVTVEGVPDGTRVSLQIGPAINGTALRDAAGYITFGQFTNQVEYADAATALNNELRAKLLNGLDAAALDGKEITFTGAFTLLTPQTVTITPVAIT
ncbi:DUF2291 family protein [Nonomuraea jabiensis]|uniref:DUF2291 family protein n=1 Tax=Nonomuraea jabiensis TaxID=882448 RepID=UPI003686D68E